MAITVERLKNYPPGHPEISAVEFNTLFECDGRLGFTVYGECGSSGLVIWLEGEGRIESEPVRHVWHKAARVLQPGEKVTLSNKA